MRVLCMGSLNIDYVYQVEHFVQAGETLSSSGLRLFCGGKGLNQSIALARAGAEVWHAGRIGADGLALRERLEAERVHTQYLTTAADVSTGHAIIQVEPSGQNAILICGGANAAISREEIAAILADFSPGDILLLQNEISNVPFAIARAHELGLRVALNPSPIDAALAGAPELALVEWLILNEVEGAALTGEREPERICGALLARFPQGKVMLTLGREGCRYEDRTQCCVRPAYPVAAVDTTAAGDTFTGYFVAGLMAGLPIPELLDLSSRAAALAVGRRGASDSIPTMEEVKAAMQAV